MGVIPLPTPTIFFTVIITVFLSIEKIFSHHSFFLLPSAVI